MLYLSHKGKNGAKAYSVLIRVATVIIGPDLTSTGYKVVFTSISEGGFLSSVSEVHNTSDMYFQER